MEFEEHRSVTRIDAVTATHSDIGEREIATSRLVNATPEAVFAAFADPTVLASWWGPAGFTNTFHEFDFRPGGFWRFVMRGPDGSDYEMTKRFVEVVPSERIVIEHEQDTHSFVMTIALAPEGEGTRVNWQMVFELEAEATRVRSFVVEANEQNLDRLENAIARR